MPTCDCGATFTLVAHLAIHRPNCLGPNPSVDDLRRVGRVTEEGGCLVWHGKTNGFGYGILSGVPATQVGETRAHRAAWVLEHGQSIPPGLNVLHSCDNPPCMNPDHLRIGTQKDNAADTQVRGRGRALFVSVPREHRACVICGSEHERLPSDPAVTCSSRCASLLSWQTKPERNMRRSSDEERIRECAECGVDFMISKPSSRVATCSTICGHRYAWRRRRASKGW